MSKKEKFAELTPEQRKKLASVKDAAALDAFLFENGFTLTDEEKTLLLEFLKTGKHPLSDGELDNVAGGRWIPMFWECKCGAINSLANVICEICGYEP